MKVTVSEKKVPNGNKLQYKLEIRHVDGRRERRFFDTKLRAEAEQANLEQQVKATGAMWLSLTAEERNDLASVYREAKDAGVKLREILEAFKRGEVSQVLPVITLINAIEQTVTSREALKRKSRYTKNLKLFLLQFARGREEMPIAKIDKPTVEAWFAKRSKNSLETLKGEKTKLSALFSYCIRNGYLKENPMKAIELRSEDADLPQIVTPKQAARLLVATRRREPQLMPYIALGLFAGIRPEELVRVTFGDIDLERKRVYVMGKTRSARYAPLPEACIAWLKVAEYWGTDAEAISPSKETIGRARVRLRRFVGGKWVQDILRHSAASYWAAEIKDIGKVAFQFGNSERMLRKHYLHPVTPEDAQAFFNLFPGKLTVARLQRGRMEAAA
jgi:integrase